MPVVPLPPYGIALALDQEDLTAAHRLTAQVRESIGLLKVGLSLFTRVGPEAIKLGQEFQLPVFLDLKLHDIPHQIERTVAQASHLGASLLTLHAAGGARMLQQAVKQVEREGSSILLAAVTVLTSMESDDLQQLGFAHSNPQQLVLHLTRLARQEGIRAFVCSPEEASLLRKEFGPDVTLITPGIRNALPSQANRQEDQKRTATLERAFLQGANWFVIGRPISHAPDPQSAAQRFAHELSQAIATQHQNDTLTP
ncbi:orotidine-5'-phosphate decarboxylase [Pajaroellobacter abortibovis]|uniref:Orotidine 5'-phosphate decarboxylase n=1 Tax=Pajaroellobacter abortibovis TaxID=1882918 RepID=A0A1L6MWI6_9BACT|nr:orotidine-5'-phosphate decarboxylase [Pajaroellobacter abortibovis]APR99778.1 orotidine 5'-phosphate decarboxylase [Pajaroellobacter abortibovis]